jgi:hypothetical protein
MEHLRDHRDLAARTADRLANVARLDPRQLLVVLFDERREAAQQRGAVGGRNGAPRRERCLRARDRSVGLVDARRLQLRERLLGRRVEDGIQVRLSSL